MDHIVIMAAGKGTRMKSELPKVLHSVKGQPIILRLLSHVTPVCPKPTLIVGHKAAEVVVATGNKYFYAEQKEQLGTGHALICAAAGLKDRKEIETIMVLPGDHPLVSTETIKEVIANHKKNKAILTLSTYTVPHFDDTYSVCNNYGRVIRDSKGVVERIVEFKDATPEEKAVREVNLSYYCFNASWLWENLSKLADTNAAHEYYLTDLVKIAKDQSQPIATYSVKNFAECLGINTPEQLKLVEDAITDTDFQNILVRGEPRPVTKS